MFPGSQQGFEGGRINQRCRNENIAGSRERISEGWLNRLRAD